MSKKTHPYWKAHTILSPEPTPTSSSGGGTKYWQCKYCKSSYSSTITRVICHVSGIGGNGIGGCTSVPRDIADVVIAEQGHIFKGKVLPGREKRAEEDDALLHDHSDVGSTQSRKRAHMEDASQSSCASDSHHEVEIALTLVECNISFNVLRTTQWKRMIRACADVGPLIDTDTWTGVEYHRMRKGMLDEERECIDIFLAPIRDSWVQYGCTIMADGWSDCRHMINILVSSCLGTIFLRAIDVGVGGERVTGEFIYRHIRKAILEIAHCLDLMMEDISKLSWVQPVVQRAVRIVTFLRKKRQALAIFRKHSPNLDIIRPSKTRFAYTYLDFDRLSRLRNPLRTTMVDPQWKLMAVAHTNAAQNVRFTLLDDQFWRQIDQINHTLRPLWKLLRLTGTEGSTLGLLYPMFHEMHASIQICTYISDDRRETILQIVDSRLEYMQCPIHGIAALLHPLYKEPEWMHNPDLLAAHDQYLGRTLNIDMQVQFDRDFICYMTSVGPAFSRPTVFNRDIWKSPVDWWETYGYSTPVVTTIALRVLSQDCSVSARERNWSAYSLIHTKLRNRLSTQQFQNLVYCRANLKVAHNLKTMRRPIQREDEEEIYRLLHKELEVVSRQVTGSWASTCSPSVRIHPSTSSLPFRGRLTAVGRGSSILEDTSIPSEATTRAMDMTLSEYDDEESIFDASSSSSESLDD
ncbi:hypothetical protein KP509_13G039800 [Ceratopteris richardii]|uniref:HAT C-terminal dimerisation domain-containing protein n=1 Tax=Ceratopteris richardii TaxID=49495 RepID=A0A8T2TIB5_CERRI|nr:hypothetical protein KP509_13G039800 [Ceratopteris richardii]